MTMAQAERVAYGDHPLQVLDIYLPREVRTDSRPAAIPSAHGMVAALPQRGASVEFFIEPNADHFQANRGFISPDSDAFAAALRMTALRQ